jgi:uncharacterized protein
VFENIGRLLVRKRVTFAYIICFSLLASLLSIYNQISTTGIPLDFSPQSIFMDNSEMMIRLEEIESHFGRGDNDFILLLHGPNLNSSEGKITLEELHKAIDNVPEVQSIRSLWNANQLTGEGGFLEVERLWDSEPFTRANEDPLLKGTLVSSNHQTTIIQATIDPALEKVQDLKPVIQKITEQIESVDIPPDLKTMSTGIPFVRVEVVDMMVDDELFYVPITAFMFLITVIILFRGILVSFAPLIAVIGAMIWAISLLLAFGVSFNLLSILTPTITLIIGIADGIHLVSRYREELQYTTNKEEAMGRTLKHMIVACFLTTFTTASGFLSLLVAQTSVIRDFGLHSAFAVMIAFFAVVLIVPVWLSFLSIEQIGPAPTKDSGSHRYFETLYLFITKRTVLIIGVTLLFVGVVGYYARTIRPNSSILEMYQEDHATSKAIRMSEKELSGIVPIYINFEVKEGNVLYPKLLSDVRKVEDELRKFEMITWTYSLSGQLHEIHKKISGNSDFPDTKEMIAQELLMTQMAGEIPINRVLSEDKKNVRILALTKDIGGRKFIEMREHMLTTIQAMSIENDNVQVDVTGDGLLASVGIDNLISDLLSSIALVFAVIASVMLLLLRNLRLTLIACIPNVIPLIFTLATLRFIGADLQISNIVSFTVAIGIAVDDTIHFIIRYKQELEKGNNHSQSLRNSFHGAGNAIILTSLLLISGFGVVATSDLTTTHQFGLLASVTLVTAVLADLIFLPALLELNDKWSRVTTKNQQDLTESTE